MFGKKKIQLLRAELADTTEVVEQVMDERDSAEERAERVEGEMAEICDFAFDGEFTENSNLTSRLQVLKDKERIVDAFLAMIRGEYDADADFIRKMACALGTSALDPEAVIRRAGQFTTLRAQNLGLTQTVKSLHQRLDECYEAAD